MPIYVYRCRACTHEEERLQKVADTPLTHCPACGRETFAKQLTAASFQLKGTGWYATDFRDKSRSQSAQKKKDAQSGTAKSGAAESSAENAGGKSAAVEKTATVSTSAEKSS